MPQPNRFPRFQAHNNQARDVPVRGDIPGADSKLLTHLSESQQQLFPPLVNPHAGHQNNFGRRVQAGAHQQPNVWHRPAGSQPPALLGDAPGKSVIPGNLNPCTAQSWLSQQRNDDEGNANTTKQMGVSQSGSECEMSSGTPYEGNDELCSKGSSVSNGSLWQKSEEKISNSVYSKDQLRSAGNGHRDTTDDDNRSPPRKNRSSSGPQTPPGLRCDGSFDFTAESGGNFEAHNLLLANIPLKLMTERDVFYDTFHDNKGHGQISRDLPQLKPKEPMEAQKKMIVNANNAQQIEQIISQIMSLSQTRKTQCDSTIQKSLDAIVSSLTTLRQNADKLCPEDQVVLTKVLQLIKLPEKEYLDTIVRELASIHYGKDDVKKNTDESGVTSINSLKILQRDWNNNMPRQEEFANAKKVCSNAESLDEESVCAKSTQNVSIGLKNNGATNAATPVAFVSPFLHLPYQSKSEDRVCINETVNGKANIAFKDTNCLKCHNRFRWPHLLVCCHRFCFPCLVAMLDRENMKIQCPYCRSITHTDRSLTNLVLDLHRCREMCSIQMSPFVCTLCSNGKHADTVCKTCPAFLCERCQGKHASEPDWSSHELEPVQNVGYNKDGELQPMCSEHPGMLFSLFCVLCSVMVCDSCLVQSHANHETCDLLSGKQIAEGRFREMNCGLVDMIELCQKKLQNFNLSKQKVESTMKIVRNNVHKACNQMIDYIDMFEKMSKSLTDKVHGAGVKHINSLVKEANEYDLERATFEQFCKSYIDDSKPEELTAVLPLVHQKLKGLKDFYSKPTIINPSFSVELKFDPVYPDFNEAMSRMFAGLKFKHNVTLEALLDSPLGERAVLESAQPQPYEIGFSLAGEAQSGSSLCSTGSSSKHSFESPSGDDILKNFIRQTTPSKFIFGKYGRGEYEFAEPSGVCYLHDNSLAVCDAKNHRVMLYDEACKFIKTVGQPCNLPPLPSTLNSNDNDHSFPRTPGTLYFPFRLAECPLTHNLVIVERPPSTDIQVFSFEGNFLRCFGRDCLRYPRGITVDESGQILVVESRTMKVFIFSMDGVKLQAFYLSMHLEFPNDIAAKGGSIFVSDNRTHCVHVYDYNLEWQRQIGNESLTYFPIGVALNHQGHVVVADNHNTFNITVFSQDGGFIHGFKSQSKHANCYSVALHPRRTELAVTTKECRVVLFDYNMSDHQTTGKLLPN
ncbi:B-box type Zinc finger protein ncl-1 [Plakobranchus ocellatus]|uniref:B-box type Zinc finger protein ncl-1 n=1 Tax=Plakobranchus ocellatus TaxID=259542 RepID=A0AAV3ZEA7_9GAST|nr:B-box type Zinc finger protein ncl-1 [Plakobranchus ocellatus]